MIIDIKDMQTQEEILAAMAEIRVMAKGKVTVNRRSKTGRAYHSLQARKNGRNETRYVPEAKLAAVRAATANYRQFMALVQRYVELCESRLDL